MKKCIFVAIIFVLLGVIVYVVFFQERYTNEYFYEAGNSSIESSTYHENGTWWGYNQSKLMRLDDVVFTYYVDNSDQVNGVANINNPNLVVLTMINNNGDVIEFDTLPSSRPANILVDKSRKLVYAIVVEPTMTNDNGSTGKLVVYTYFFDGVEPIFLERNTIVDHNGSELETVNIRIGATIDDDGNIAIVYGLADASYTFSMVVQLYDVENDLWYEESVYMNGVKEPNFYPDIAMKSLNDFVIVAVQDNCVDYNGSCAYLYLRYFIYQDGLWQYDILDDYRDYDNKSDKLTLVEHTEVYLDSEGIYHLVWRSMAGEQLFHHVHIDENKQLISRELIIHKDINWLRIVEVDHIKYFIGHGNNRTQIIDFETLEVLHNDQSTQIDGAYFYVFSDGTQIDCLLLNGNSSTYGDQDDEYISYKRIDLN